MEAVTLQHGRPLANGQPALRPSLAKRCIQNGAKNKGKIHNGQEIKLALAHQLSFQDLVGDISGLNRGSVVAPNGIWISFENFFAAVNLFGHEGCEFGGMLSIGPEVQARSDD